MSEKMLTETEWWIEICKYCSIQSVNDILPSDARIMFRLARQGMMPVPDAGGYKKWLSSLGGIPTSEQVWQAAIAWAESSGRYIRVPDVSEWPYGSIGIVARYTAIAEDGYADKPLAYITRPTPPKPVWEPNALQAGETMSDLPEKIMNIQVNKLAQNKAIEESSASWRTYNEALISAYKLGHRDARHAAAELAFLEEKKP
jgi:hypothetical protein